jgi:alcohol dehydrogenase
LAGFLGGGAGGGASGAAQAGRPGVCAAATTNQAGAGFVMLTWLGPGDADRLAPAVQFGADLAVDVAVEDPVADRKGEPLASRMSSST